MRIDVIPDMMETIRMGSQRSKKIILLAGDIAVFYGSLFVALFLRYGFSFPDGYIERHLRAFSVLFLLWLPIFYGARLYDIVGVQSITAFLRTAVSPILINFSVAAVYFYLFARGPDAIAPRGTLVLFSILFGIAFVWWRRAAQRILTAKLLQRAIVIGEDEETLGLASFLNKNPEYGYRVVSVASDEKWNIEMIRSMISSEDITTIIASEHAMKKFAPHLAELARLNIDFWGVATFYEMQLEKIPLSLIGETWFLENIIRREPRLFTLTKNIADRVIAGLALVVTLPLWPFIALAIKFTSAGQVFYAQTRVGYSGKPFRLLKFRTMYVDAEKNGAQWAQEQDPRITSVGRILRKTQLDELPQLLNVLKGDMSFVGPRPERPEFVEKLVAHIPFYDLRHLVKPGLTGWAQLNFRYGASIEDAKEKLQYDLYYIKNRSFALDASIIIKTLNIILRGGTGR